MGMDMDMGTMDMDMESIWIWKWIWTYIQPSIHPYYQTLYIYGRLKETPLVFRPPRDGTETDLARVPGRSWKLRDGPYPPLGTVRTLPGRSWDPFRDGPGTLSGTVLGPFLGRSWDLQDLISVGRKSDLRGSRDGPGTVLEALWGWSWILTLLGPQELDPENCEP